MGCASSTNNSDPSNPSSSPRTPDGPTVQPTDEIQVRAQRRRLSVAPQHVGDTLGHRPSAVTRTSIVENMDGVLTALEAKAKGNLQHAVLSRKGYVPYNKNKVNQDRFFVHWGVDGDASISLFGVCDGHGEFGHLVAAFIESNLFNCLSEQTAQALKADPHNAILRSVKLMCDRLSQTDINAAFSGSTLVFAVKIDSKLYVANIGDSRCVIARWLDGHLQALPLTVDQKPELPAEKARIERCGGRVEPLPGPPGECGPPRVWLAEADVPGLAMSRSIGDEVSQTVGVISVPEITEHQISESDLFVIWASDGVWEFITNEQATEVVYKHQSNLQEAASILVEESCKAWKKEEEVIDDITTVILQLKPPK